MKRIFITFLLALTAMISFADDVVYIPKPYAFGLSTQSWWRVRLNQEEFRWVDHTSKTNMAIRPLLKVESTEPNEDTKVSSGNNVSATIGPDFTVKTYTVMNATLRDDKSYDVNKIAPGTYDLVNGKWYTEMTLEEKHAKWAVYTNKVIQAILADIAERKAPAKFDVSKDPEEYLKFLMGDRDPETITPEEEREIRVEFAAYQLEWTRVNDPENYKRSLFPRDEILSEQQKKARSERFERIRERRAMMLQRRKNK